MFLMRAVRKRFAQENEVAAKFHLRQNQAPKSFQRFLLLVTEFVRHQIQDAKRAQGEAVFGNQRRASVKRMWGSETTNGLFWKRSSFRASGTTKTSDC